MTRFSSHRIDSLAVIAHLSRRRTFRKLVSTHVTVFRFEIALCIADWAATRPRRTGLCPRRRRHFVLDTTSILFERAERGNDGVRSRVIIVATCTNNATYSLPERKFGLRARQVQQDS